MSVCMMSAIRLMCSFWQDNLLMTFVVYWRIMAIVSLWSQQELWKNVFHLSILSEFLIYKKCTTEYYKLHRKLNSFPKCFFFLQIIIHEICFNFPRDFSLPQCGSWHSHSKYRQIRNRPIKIHRGLRQTYREYQGPECFGGGGCVQDPPH